jgi:hypothetical protein
MFDRFRRATGQPANESTNHRLPHLSASVGFVADPHLSAGIADLERDHGHVLRFVAFTPNHDGIVALDQYGSHFILTAQGVN